MGVYSKNKQYIPDVKRNNFDQSYQNNLTLGFGYEIPFFCKDVLPGDTTEIDAALGLRFMPMTFPAQTKIRCDVHFFYVRNRNLFKGFNDLVFDNDSTLTMPYLSVRERNRQLTTKSLGDYLGLPTTVVGSNVRSENIGDLDNKALSVPNGVQLLVNPSTLGGDKLAMFPLYQHPNFSPNYAYNYKPANGSQVSALAWKKVHSYLQVLSTDSEGRFYQGEVIRFKFETSYDVLNEFDGFFYLFAQYRNNVNDWIEQVPVGLGGITKVGGDNPNMYYLTFVVQETFNVDDYYDCYLGAIMPANNLQLPVQFFTDGSFILHGVSTGFTDVLDASSILGIIPEDFRISALPFRAYESIHNAFYRDDRNNPYILNGKVEYNKYIPSQEGGVDDNIYQLHRRNWEQDFLTTATTSPQMGVAPLVGVTSTGVATFQDLDSGKSYKVQLETAEDGDTVVGGTYTENIPGSVARALMNTSTSGISINDLRSVNALQRWLETNIRRGMKARDQIIAHFGVTPDYAELDMPEFLGGFSQYAQINQVDQTSQTTELSPLGSFAGQAALRGGSKHKIRHFADEHGYIIGIVSVVPVPCYSQLLPKHFTKFNALDFFSPEFGHLGHQPIPYREVCPLQAILNGTSLDSTFGYQRAWYEYLSSVDEVHGDFRTNLKDFILGRVFNTVPSLNPSFLTVDEDQLNNIFAVEDEAYDKILGQIHVDCVMKRPIPRFGIPKLE